MVASEQVPDIVGMPFHVARDALLTRGIALAGTDPDGPPLGAVAWPGPFVIASQSPPPGGVLGLGESIRVTVVPGDAGGSDAGARVATPPPAPIDAVEAREQS